MSYNTTALAAHDGDLQQRFTACAAAEGVNSPLTWVLNNIWALVVDPGVADAYASAHSSGLAEIGKRDDVVTDAVILAVTQARITANPPA